MTDNGPQYSSNEFRTSAEFYKFSHTTSGSYYPRRNEEAERAKRTLKTLLKDVKDPYLALLSYRATPLPWCNLSPVQLLMGRIIRILVPEADEVLILNWPNLAEFKKVDENYKKKLKHQYDRRHRVRELPEFADDTEVFVVDGRSPNVVPWRIIQLAGTRSLFC